MNTWTLDFKTDNSFSAEYVALQQNKNTAPSLPFLRTTVDFTSRGAHTDGFCAVGAGSEKGIE